MKQDDPMIKVLNKLDDLTTEVKALRSDVGTTKSDVKILGLRLDTAETRSKAMLTDLSDLKAGLRRVEILHEETDTEIKQIIEVAVPNAKQITKLRKHTEKQDETISFHERRIGFLEKKVA
jgi:chromosome segregation ATPase